MDLIDGGSRGTQIQESTRQRGGDGKRCLFQLLLFPLFFSSYGSAVALGRDEWRPVGVRWFSCSGPLQSRTLLRENEPATTEEKSAQGQGGVDGKVEV